MSKIRYCECGRKIVIRINGRTRSPRDNDHILCQRCWLSAQIKAADDCQDWPAEGTNGA